MEAPLFTGLIAGVMLIAVLAIALAGHTRRERPRSSADGNVTYAGDGSADCDGGSADSGCDGGGGGG